MALLDKRLTEILIFICPLKKIAVRDKPAKQGDNVMSEDHVNYKVIVGMFQRSLVFGPSPCNSVCLKELWFYTD